MRAWRFSGSSEAATLLADLTVPSSSVRLTWHDVARLQYSTRRHVWPGITEYHTPLIKRAAETITAHSGTWVCGEVCDAGPPRVDLAEPPADEMYHGRRKHPPPLTWLVRA